jgi:hypothetical protein
MLNLFQHPLLRGSVLLSKWTLNQVEGDGVIPLSLPLEPFGSIAATNPQWYLRPVAGKGDFP